MSNYELHLLACYRWKQNWKAHMQMILWYFLWKTCFDGKSTQKLLISASWATPWQFFFSRYQEILPSTMYMPNLTSIGSFKQKLQRGAESPPPPPPPRPYQSAKSPVWVKERVKENFELPNGVNSVSNHLVDLMSKGFGEPKWCNEFRSFQKNISQFHTPKEKLIMKTCLFYKFGTGFCKNVQYLETRAKNFRVTFPWPDLPPTRIGQSMDCSRGTQVMLIFLQ